MNYTDIEIELPDNIDLVQDGIGRFFIINGDESLTIIARNGFACRVESVYSVLGVFDGHYSKSIKDAVKFCINELFSRGD